MNIWKGGWERAGSVGAMGKCRATFKDVTSRCSKWRPGWRLTNKDKLCHATVLVVHVTWMSVLIPLCYSLLRGHEEQIIRAASDCLHIYWVTIGNAGPRGSAVWLSREHVALLSCSRQKKPSRTTDWLSGSVDNEAGAGIHVTGFWVQSFSTQSKQNGPELADDLHI